MVCSALTVKCTKAVKSSVYPKSDGADKDPALIGSDRSQKKNRDSVTDTDIPVSLIIDFISDNKDNKIITARKNDEQFISGSFELKDLLPNMLLLFKLITGYLVDRKALRAAKN